MHCAGQMWLDFCPTSQCLLMHFKSEIISPHFHCLWHIKILLVQYGHHLLWLIIYQIYLLDIKYFRVFQNGSFLISCSGEEEEGLYQCTATNSLNEIRKTVSLDVQGKFPISDRLKFTSNWSSIGWLSWGSIFYILEFSSWILGWGHLFPLLYWHN